ncbi:hypothetical protein BD289DRAFT_269197 [Coniella lustricola]|uniref:Rhodopsin domain-containing protein n=1 Tax=Coniella lustricola TaxID=2025994 RepID=A0A2T3AK78_9PEZI|nr:hypothetical protein BD289DRAFT_269197 [Coniella lustricola]
MTLPAFVILNWTLTVVLTIFVALRIYTRMRYVSRYGLDDLFYVGAFVSYLTVAIVQHIAYANGLGRDGEGVSHDSKFLSNIMFLVGDVGQSLAEALSKASAGFFLLRLVFQLWQKILIVATSGIFAALCVVGAIIAWTSCTPYAAAWDDRNSGSCNRETAVPIVFCITTVSLDVLFAAMPWMLVWNQSRSAFEKLLIAGPLSLGAVAAGIGVGRLVAIYGADPLNVTIHQSMWTMGEIFTTLVGVGIPSTLPVWRAIYRKCGGQRSAQRRVSSYHVLGQYTIGGSIVMAATLSVSQRGSTTVRNIQRIKPCVFSLKRALTSRDEGEEVEKRGPRP